MRTCLAVEALSGDHTSDSWCVPMYIRARSLRCFYASLMPTMASPWHDMHAAMADRTQHRLKLYCRLLLQASARDRSTSSAAPPPPAPVANACAPPHVVAPARRGCAPDPQTCSAAGAQRRRRGRLAVKSAERLAPASARTCAAGRARQVGKLSGGGVHSAAWQAVACCSKGVEAPRCWGF
jgi:hypothetical protein